MPPHPFVKLKNKIPSKFLYAAQVRKLALGSAVSPGTPGSPSAQADQGSLDVIDIDDPAAPELVGHMFVYPPSATTDWEEHWFHSFPEVDNFELQERSSQCGDFLVVEVPKVKGWYSDPAGIPYQDLSYTLMSCKYVSPPSASGAPEEGLSTRREYLVSMAPTTGGSEVMAGGLYRELVNGKWVDHWRLTSAYQAPSGQSVTRVRRLATPSRGLRGFLTRYEQEGGCYTQIWYNWGPPPA